MRRKILVVGMFDSIHFARWLEQFLDEDIDFLLFPSKKHRMVHKRINRLFKGCSTATFKHYSGKSIPFLRGYLDYFLIEIIGKFLKKSSRESRFEKCLTDSKIDIVHCLEFQGAGYLLDDIDTHFLSNKRVIVTNWGSDINFFSSNPQHADKIRNLLTKATHYSAECQRDYILAKELGFKGFDLPCIPNAGGFEIRKDSASLTYPSSRNQIIIKGYSGIFGRASLPVSLIPPLAAKFPQFNFFVYSCDDDIANQIKSFSSEVRQRIRVSTIKKKLEHDALLTEFQKSRIYIGCSNSDGISTSFLESIVTGAFPIQSDTSCANEWVLKGFRASIIPLDSSRLWESIVDAVENDLIVDQAFEQNQNLALIYLSKSEIQKKALEFYR